MNQYQPQHLAVVNPHSPHVSPQDAWIHAAQERLNQQDRVIESLRNELLLAHSRVDQAGAAERETAQQLQATRAQVVSLRQQLDEYRRHVEQASKRSHDESRPVWAREACEIRDKVRSQLGSAFQREMKELDRTACAAASAVFGAAHVACELAVSGAVRGVVSRSVAALSSVGPTCTPVLFAADTDSPSDVVDRTVGTLINYKSPTENYLIQE